MSIPVELIRDDRKVFSFCGNDIEFKRIGNGQCELVLHDNECFKNLTVRWATKPYCCNLYLQDEQVIQIDLASSEDWGNIQQCIPGDCEDWKDSIGWGNDEDGHIKIIKVTTYVYDDEVEIPLEVFKRDVEDLLILHES